MAISMGDVAVICLLAGIGVSAWRRQDAGGKTWAFRIIPFGILLMKATCYSKAMFCWSLAVVFAVYAFAACYGGWRLNRPQNRILRSLWWGTHIVTYFVMIFTFCCILASFTYTFGRLFWTNGWITDDLPFAVEYRRAPTLCPEYDKRIRFKSGKRVDLLMDTCGYGPFRVYRLNDGDYCLVDGYGMPDHPRYQRVNVEKETVDLQCTDGNLDDMVLIGEINTSGRFKKARQQRNELQVRP